MGGSGLRPVRASSRRRRGRPLVGGVPGGRNPPSSTLLQRGGEVGIGCVYATGFEVDPSDVGAVCCLEVDAIVAVAGPSAFDELSHTLAIGSAPDATQAIRQTGPRSSRGCQAQARTTRGDDISRAPLPRASVRVGSSVAQRGADEVHVARGQMVLHRDTGVTGVIRRVPGRPKRIEEPEQ